MRQPKFYRKFDYDRALLPNSYLASLDNAKTIEEAKDNTGFSIGYPGWGLVYHILMSHLHHEKYNLIVETGTNQGCTTIILAQALKDSKCLGRIYTVELEPGNFSIALSNFRKAGVEQYIDAVNADSKKALRDLVRKHTDIRVAFLDASHLYDDVIEEFEIILPALGPQSIVIFDNTYLIAEEHEDQRVNGALREIMKRHGGNLINLEFVSWYTPGIAIWQKAPFDSKGPCNPEGAEYLKELTGDVDGRIVLEEAGLLYELARESVGLGEIVEIGSFQGYSTIWLASGTKERKREKVYAVDPHNTDLHGKNESIFRENLVRTGVDDYVVPIVKTSTDAATDWNMPIRLLYIDGAHDYENVKNDFLLWEKHLIDGGTIAFHDSFCIFWPDVGDFIQDYVFSSEAYADFKCVNTIICARKVGKTSQAENEKKEEFIRGLLLRAKAVKNYRKAQRMIENGNFVEAGSLLESCESHINDFISPEYRMLNMVSIGNCYRKMGNYGKAGEIFKEILDYKSDKNLVHKRYRALLGLADLYFAQKKYTESADYFREVLNEEHIPGRVRFRALAGIGRSYYVLKKFDLSMKSFEEALSTDGITEKEKYEVMLGLGRCCLGIMKYHEAVEKFKDALSRDGLSELESYFAMAELGRSYLLLGNYPEAERELINALSISSVPAETRVNTSLQLGTCYSRQGKSIEEEKAYLDALAYRDISNVSHILKYRLKNRLGNIYLMRGSLQKAEMFFLEAISLDGVPGQDWYHAMYGLGKCLFMQERYQEAEEQFGRTFSLEDVDGGLKLSAAEALIECCFVQGKYHNIESVCEKVVSQSGISDNQKRNLIAGVRERIKSFKTHHGGANA